MAQRTSPPTTPIDSLPFPLSGPERQPFTHLSLDTRDGARLSFRETDNPSRQQVLDAVDKPDSSTRTEVSLRRDEPLSLHISGSSDLFPACSGNPRRCFRPTHQSPG